ncbi:hypothetical protein ACA910_014188 [Epithemia clementina (nom. ined.)]
MVIQTASTTSSQSQEDARAMKEMYGQNLLQSLSPASPASRRVSAVHNNAMIKSNNNTSNSNCNKNSNSNNYHNDNHQVVVVDHRESEPQKQKAVSRSSSTNNSSNNHNHPKVQRTVKRSSSSKNSGTSNNNNYDNNNNNNNNSSSSSKEDGGSWIEETVNEADVIWVEETICEEDEDWVEEEEDEEEDEDLENEAACLAAVRRSLSGDLLGIVLPYHELECSDDAQSIISTLSMDMASTMHGCGFGVGGGSHGNHGDDALGVGDLCSQSEHATLLLHNLIRQSDWEMLQREWRNMEVNTTLLRRALLRRYEVGETTLHVICTCPAAPTSLVLHVLDSLDRLGLANELLTTAFDEAENTVLHAVCAHIRSKKTSSSSLLSSSLRRRSKSSSRKKKSSSSAGGGSSGKMRRRHSLLGSPNDCAMMPQLEPIEESESSNFTDSFEIQEVPPLPITPTKDSSPVLDFTILKTLVLLAPQVLEMTNRSGDTPMHLLVTSPGFRIAKYKRRSSETSMAAEIAAEDVMVQLLDVIPREVAVHANHQGLTMLHCAIARGAHELVLVQLLRQLRHAAALPDSRGMYPLHYVAMNSKIVPWTFVDDLIAAYPDALVAQTYQKGDTPLHLLLSCTLKKIREHERKEHRKRRSSLNNASSSTTQRRAHKEFYLDRNTAKLAELLARTTTDHRSSAAAAGDSFKLRTSARHHHHHPRLGEAANKIVKTCALMITNHEHMSPLHYCAKVGISAERLIQILMKSKWANKACLLQTQVDRLTPLHLACSQKPCCTGTVEALAAATHACAVQDCQGRTPLATAILNSTVPNSVVKVLMDAYKRAVEIPSHGNFLPLHLALQHEQSESICKYLVKASSKKCLETQTVSGDTPLHMACAQSESSPRIVKMLVDRFPEAMFLRNTAGQSPFDLARIFNPILIKAIPQLETARLHSGMEGSSSSLRVGRLGGSGGGGGGTCRGISKDDYHADAGARKSSKSSNKGVAKRRKSASGGTFIRRSD